VVTSAPRTRCAARQRRAALPGEEDGADLAGRGLIVAQPSPGALLPGPAVARVGPAFDKAVADKRLCQRRGRALADPDEAAELADSLGAVPQQRHEQLT